MLRTLVLTFGAAVGVRKGGSQNGLQPSHRELMSALIERGRKFDARSLVEVMESITPTVAGNITDIVTEMEHTVLQSIRDAHTETQNRLDGYVADLELKVNATSDKKTAANQLDLALQNCVSQEKTEIESTIDKQNTYNVKQKATFEPCAREVSTAKFTATNGAISEQCDTDADPVCAAAIVRLEGKIGTAQSSMESFFDGKVLLHKTAENDCDWAEGNASAALTAVETQQGVWNGQYDACVLAKGSRNTGVCTFGEKLQDACDVYNEYLALKALTEDTNNIHSEQDRKDEALAIQTVMCVLNDFLQNNDITEDSTKNCHNSVSLGEFDLDLKTSEVSDILAVNHNDALTVTCVDNEKHSFQGGHWASPVVSQKPVSYLYNTIPSDENVTLQSYQWETVWELEVDLTNANQPFQLSECSSSS